MTRNEKVSSWPKVTKNDKKWHKRDPNRVPKLMWYLKLNYSAFKMLKNAKKVKCDWRTFALAFSLHILESCDRARPFRSIDSQGRRSALFPFFDSMILPPKAVSIETVAGPSQTLSEYFHRYHRCCYQRFHRDYFLPTPPVIRAFSYRRLPYLVFNLTKKLRLFRRKFWSLSKCGQFLVLKKTRVPPSLKIFWGAQEGGVLAKIFTKNR